MKMDLFAEEKNYVHRMMHCIKVRVYILFLKKRLVIHLLKSRSSTLHVVEMLTQRFGLFGLLARPSLPAEVVN